MAVSSIQNQISLNQEWAKHIHDGSAQLPFSFVYDGIPVSESMSHWKREVFEKQIDPTNTQRTLILTDPATGLEVEMVAHIYADTPGVDWIIHLTNRGSEDTPVIEKVAAVDITIDPSEGDSVVLHRLKGNLTDAAYSVEDFQPFDVPMQPGKRVEFGPPISLSSCNESPFFNLQYGHRGVITAVGWSGHWGASVEQNSDRSVRVEAGMRDTRLRLHPGETIRTPRILQVYWSGGDEPRSYNLFRHTMFTHIMPRIDGKLVVPPIAHGTNVYYSQNSGTEEEILEYLDSIKGLGFECLWLDAFYSRDGWPDGIGNYGYPIDMLVDTKRYPRSLTPISDAAHKEGMIFLLWTAPERACKGTYLYESHPEWMLGEPERQAKPHTDEPLQEGEFRIAAVSDRHTKLYDMGNSDAREYMTRYLIDLINAYKIDCIRFDCGAFIDDLRMKDAREPDRAGMAEIRYHEGLYKMWDDILEACPSVFIDNCCGGGNRIDLETCSRSLPLWRTDGVGYALALWNPPDYQQAALQNQVITAGLSRYVPFSTSSQMGVTPYLFRSAFNAGIVFAEDIRAADYPREELRKAIAEGKRIRKYFFGNFYPLNEVSTSQESWCALQYHLSEGGSGIVLAFRRHKSPFPSLICDLHEIDPEAIYSVTISSTYEHSSATTMNGHELRLLQLTIDEMPGSVLVEYTRRDSS